MDESEKLTALKKAYADIILNTAKEAAARIMVSERKAIRFQQELSETKDEAFRILLRLKQMLDFKANEAEMVSINQKKKIEELEAQLEEAEDIVRELRAELQEVQDELENVRNQKEEPLGKPSLGGNLATRDDLSNSHEPVEAYNGSTTLNGTCLENLCESKTHLQMDNGQVHSQDFASMVMRSKEPELYRNGCTQRVRAFEGKLFDGKVRLTGQAEDVKTRAFNVGEQEGKLMCKTNIPKSDDMCGEKKNTNEPKASPKLASKDIQGPKLKSIRRKRKRAARYNKRKSLPILRDIMKQCKSPDLHLPESLSVDNNDSKICLSKVNEIDDQNGLVLLSTPVLSDIKEMSSPSGCPDVSESGVTVLNNCSFRNTMDCDKVILDKPDTTDQENLSAENLEASAYKIDLEAVKESSVLDMKITDALDEVPNQHLNNKVLKYTFQRKRKKESLSSPDGKSSVDESILKKRMKDKHSASLESEEFSLVTESSRDTRRLAQVARQLISLSEKKWR